MSDPQPETRLPARTLLGWLRAGMSIVTGLSIYASGLLGILVIQAVGPYLAMGMHIYTGNTEPHRPSLPWPLGLTLLAGLLPIPLAATRRFSLAMIASIPLALVPWWQLYCLYIAAA